MNPQRVLIIEDLKAMRTSIRRTLEDEGYEIVETCHGREGLDALQTHPIDLVITDIIMPEMDGIETIMQIRKDYPSMRILAISSGGNTKVSHLLGMARRLGAHDTLAKPFTSADLLARVERLLERKSGTDAPALN